MMSPIYGLPPPSPMHPAQRRPSAPKAGLPEHVAETSANEAPHSAVDSSVPRTVVFPGTGGPRPRSRSFNGFTPPPKVATNPTMYVEPYH